ncbi:hypothetical protein CLU79DRAFT_767569 [Phycomyces nitens]|nr:hypothetical protein CLU79DRAFT_767569 [Phycomyces nitens]
MESNNSEEWIMRLLGKTIVDKDDETTVSSCDVFYEADLPEPYRVLGPGSIMTRDFIPNRLNVFVDDNKIVTNVYYC